MSSNPSKVLPRHRAARLTRVKRHLRFRRQNWAYILLTDEYHRERECCPDPYAMQHRPFGDGSVMVWGDITKRGRTLLIVISGYLTGTRYKGEIAQPYAILFIQAQGNNVIFQQDNAGPHVARVLRDYLTQQNVDVLPWPAVSLDLSHIELVWDELERPLRYFQNQPVVSETISHKHFLAH